MSIARNMADLAGSASDLTTVAADASVLAAQADGYTYRETVTFTSSGTFSKGDYPWLRAIRVKVQGAGGGGGGIDDCDAVGEAAAASGGGAGGYSESFISDIASLASSVTVTVGTGGAGGAGGGGSAAGNSGADGGPSSFGSGLSYEVSAYGGRGGVRGFETQHFNVQRGAFQTANGVGDLQKPGEPTYHSVALGAVEVGNPRGLGTNGGSSPLGTGGQGRESYDEVFAGQDADGYGAGGGGASGSAATTTFNGVAGGNGTDGIVIIELYA